MTFLWLVAAAAGGGGVTWDWTKGGALGILAGAVTAFLRGWIVPGWHYKEVCGQRDRALEQVFRLAEIAQRATEAAERKKTGT